MAVVVLQVGAVDGSDQRFTQVQLIDLIENKQGKSRKLRFTNLILNDIVFVLCFLIMADQL